MPLVKLTIRAEPVEVDDGELGVLRGQGLVDHVLDAVPAPVIPPGPVDPPKKPVPAKPGQKQEK